MGIQVIVLLSPLQTSANDPVNAPLSYFSLEKILGVEEEGVEAEDGVCIGGFNIKSLLIQKGIL